MAIVSRKVSDLSGQEGNDKDFAMVIVQQYPSLDRSKALDVLESEVGGFKEIGDLVMLEVQSPNGDKKDIAMRKADFDKLAPDMGKVLEDAHDTRGRLPGTKMNGNGS